MSYNPYSSALDPTQPTILQNEWARTGFRRSLVNYPWFVDAKSGDIIVSERDSHRLQIFDCTGNETRFEPFGCRGPRENQFLFPGGVTTTSILGANVIVADTGNRRITTFGVGSDKQGYGILKQTNTFGHQIFAEPTGVEMDMRKSHLVVADPAKRRVTIHDIRDGKCIGELQNTSSHGLLAPTDIALDENGRIYVTDANGHHIQVYDTNGEFITKFGGFGGEPGQLNKPWGICFDREYNLLVADEGNNRIQMFAPNGRLLKVIASDVYIPKGVSVNIHEDLVVTTGDPYNFIKILNYK